MATFTRWYLTFEQGTSSKFYEVIYLDGRYAARWGRIGAPKGQMLVETGDLWDAEARAISKRDKGYEWTERKARYALNANTETALNDALDKGKDGAGLLAHVVDTAINEAMKKEVNEDAPTVTDHIDLLVTRAQNLVPLVAADPMQHITTIAEIRQGAQEQRDKLRRLDAHLETLDVLLTSRA